MRACGCAEKKRQIVELVETKAIQVQSHKLHRYFHIRKKNFLYYLLANSINRVIIPCKYYLVNEEEKFLRYFRKKY